MRIIVLFFSVLLLIGCNNQADTEISAVEKEEIIPTSAPNFGIVIHGGAGTILKENMTDSMEIAYRRILEEAIRAGHKILKEGGTSMEAVTKTINIMEDSPLFNAGKGAVFTHDETNELDASVMDGATLNAGAVAGVTRVRNPIDLALEVMNNSPHVMLTGAGAEMFAEERGIELVDPSYFYTERRFKSLQRVKEREKNQSSSASVIEEEFIRNSRIGTVGCAALDKNGNLAAGTSTGGMTNKRWNRVGDAPIIGAGTYANNATCAVSSTGWGEYFIRAMVAHDISAMMEYKGVTIEEAAREVIHDKVGGLGGDGGIVAIDKDGNIAMEFNTAGMYRAHMDKNGTLVIGIYEK